MLELHGYSAPLFSFIEATAANPDLLIDAPLDADSVVVDGGAYVGEWAARVHDRYGSRIVAFEPSPNACAQFERALGATPAVELHRVGLGGSDSVAELVEAGPGASIYDLTPTGVAAGPTTEITIRDVVALFAELGIDHVDLLKLNIEGGEYDVLDRLAGAGWLERIDVVSVQFHEWHPDAHRRRRRIRRALAATHDETWCHAWVWELWTRRR
jgi:FkbM family methyltransferase